jgi:hypothetical protein
MTLFRQPFDDRHTMGKTHMAAQHLVADFLSAKNPPPTWHEFYTTDIVEQDLVSAYEEIVLSFQGRFDDFGPDEDDKLLLEKWPVSAKHCLNNRSLAKMDKISPSVLIESACMDMDNLRHKVTGQRASAQTTSIELDERYEVLYKLTPGLTALTIEDDAGEAPPEVSADPQPSSQAPFHPLFHHISRITEAKTRKYKIFEQRKPQLAATMLTPWTTTNHLTPLATDDTDDTDRADAGTSTQMSLAFRPRQMQQVAERYVRPQMLDGVSMTTCEGLRPILTDSVCSETTEQVARDEDHAARPIHCQVRGVKSRWRTGTWRILVIEEYAEHSLLPPRSPRDGIDAWHGQRLVRIAIIKSSNS